VALYLLSLPTSAHWFYYGLTARPAQILVGCALSLWLLHPRTVAHVPPRAVDLAGFLAVLALGSWTVFGVLELSDGYRWVGYPIATVSAAVLCAVPLVAPGARIQRLLSVKPLAVLGLVSYSLYLWHLLAIQVLDKDRLPVAAPVLGVLAVLATVGLTMLSFRFLEKPFLSARAKSLGLTVQSAGARLPAESPR
jgi:peptidoglycan/LPS O-acetylase OafA/YrhL